MSSLVRVSGHAQSPDTLPGKPDSRSSPTLQSLAPDPNVQEPHPIVTLVRMQLCELEEGGPVFAHIDLEHPRAPIPLTGYLPGSGQTHLGEIWKDSDHILRATIPDNFSRYLVRDLMRLFVEVFNDSSRAKKLVITAPWKRREIFLNNGFRKPWFSRVFVRDRSSLPLSIKHRLIQQNILTF